MIYYDPLLNSNSYTYMYIHTTVLYYMYVRTADTLKHEWSLTHFCTSIQTEGRTDGRKDEQTVGQKIWHPVSVCRTLTIMADNMAQRSLRAKCLPQQRQWQSSNSSRRSRSSSSNCRNAIVQRKCLYQCVCARVCVEVKKASTRL